MSKSREQHLKDALEQFDANREWRVPEPEADRITELVRNIARKDKIETMACRILENYQRELNRC